MGPTAQPNWHSGIERAAGAARWLRCNALVTYPACGQGKKLHTRSGRARGELKRSGSRPPRPSFLHAVRPPRPVARRRPRPRRIQPDAGHRHSPGGWRLFDDNPAIATREPDQWVDAAPGIGSPRFGQAAGHARTADIDAVGRAVGRTDPRTDRATRDQCAYGAAPIAPAD